MNTLWHLQVIPSPQGTLVQGVVLARTPPVPSSSPLHNGMQVLRTYFVPVQKRREVFIRWGGGEQKCVTDNRGKFHAFIEQASIEKVQIYSDNIELKPVGKYPTYFQDTGAGVGVISDIDDTVIQSYTAQNLKRIRTTLFTTTSRRKPVVFIQELFRKTTERGWPTYYVSKSESNLYGVLTSVFIEMNLPQGPLFLTPYLSFKGLLQGKSPDHKIEQIRWLMSAFPDRKFLLFGDDSQKDMQVYGEAIGEFEGRILHVFIRQTALRVSVNKTEEYQNLQATGVPVMYFNEEDDTAEALERIASYGVS